MSFFRFFSRQPVWGHARGSQRPLGQPESSPDHPPEWPLSLATFLPQLSKIRETIFNRLRHSRNEITFRSHGKHNAPDVTSKVNSGGACCPSDFGVGF